ncbi:MAG: hypothetical protein Q9164_007586 [Protoblastenia rupestris]
MVGSPLHDAFFSRRINLDEVNERLQWNHLPSDRQLGSQSPPPYQFSTSYLSSSPETDLTTPSIEPYDRARHLREARQIAKAWAFRLTDFAHGRSIVMQEPSQGYEPKFYNPRYWDARAEYFKAELSRLEDLQEDSRTPTPYVVHPCLFGPNELDQAKGHAHNAANILEMIPAGERFLAAESHGSCVHDPQYWWCKEKEYTHLYETLHEEYEVARARQHALSKATRLATYPQGQKWLASQTDSLPPYPANARYWEQKETAYCRALKRYRQDFWNEQKLKFGQEVSLLRVDLDGRLPFGFEQGDGLIDKTANEVFFQPDNVDLEPLGACYDALMGMTEQAKWNPSSANYLDTASFGARAQVSTDEAAPKVELDSG